MSLDRGQHGGHRQWKKALPAKRAAERCPSSSPAWGQLAVWARDLSDLSRPPAAGPPDAIAAPTKNTEATCSQHAAVRRNSKTSIRCLELSNSRSSFSNKLGHPFSTHATFAILYYLRWPVHSSAKSILAFDPPGSMPGDCCWALPVIMRLMGRIGACAARARRKALFRYKYKSYEDHWIIYHVYMV